MAEREMAPARFDINAAVVFRLGEELITDVVQALVELVKNSYDADATWVKVTIDTRGPNKSGRNYDQATGVIAVQDDGHGMDELMIHRGWLTIANSPKRREKTAGKMTPGGRTPMGDKGLGRLGSQRLAHNVEIVTRPKVEPTSEYYVAFSWRDFRETANLGKVPLEFQRATVNEGRHGTKLILSDLREPATWQGERHLRALQTALSVMISPFQEAHKHNFHVHVQVDGKRIELAEIAQRVRDTALLKYVFEFDGEFLRVSGVTRINYLQPSDKQDRQLLNDLCRGDHGKALYEFLARDTGKRPTRFEFSDCPEWFVEFGKQRSLDDLDRVRRADSHAVNPGPFRGEVDVVSLDSSDFKSDVIDRQSDYRRLVRDLAGIRVYRDGFGVRVGEDWLGLGKQWTRGSSYYGLRPANVLGYVAISARDNPDLVETTSREGFQVTPHYENFLSLLSEFVRFASDSQEYLRRGVLEFLNEHRDRRAGVEPVDGYSRVTQRIGAIAGKLSSEKRKVRDHSGSLRRVTEKASKTLRRVRDEIGQTFVEGSAESSALESLERELMMVSNVAMNAEKVLRDISAALDQASELDAMREVLDRRWEMLHDEVSAFYESISLGLTAEALSHEIHQIADRLARRSAALLREIDSGARKGSVVSYVEHVRSSIAAMRKQLAHLTPSLRYLRERRERIEVFVWAEDLATFYNDTQMVEINMTVLQAGSPSFVISMNKGKLTQVFDNLVLNAEYWLKEAIRAGYTNSGEITIVTDAPMVRFMDNGRGVDESVEDSLFEPFITTKEGGEGRGLGLFVARQLLDSESCNVVLLPQRNARGRRYIFEINLSGAISA